MDVSLWLDAAFVLVQSVIASTYLIGFAFVFSIVLVLIVWFVSWGDGR